MPCYFSIGASIGVSLLLMVILTLRELHHSRIQTGLIDKILEQHGLNAIPTEHPLAELVTNAQRKADEPQRKPERVRLDIPGMAAFRHQYNRVVVAKENKK